MPMNAEMKAAGHNVAELFLTTMPDDVLRKYMTRKLLHQLAYFYCWIRLMDEQGDLLDEEIEDDD